MKRTEFLKMKSINLLKYYSWIFLLCLLILLGRINCFPVDKNGLKLQPEEKRFPNGTIIGRYSYTDNEGNPVEVKYYADKSSYGVELNSIKVVNNVNGEVMKDNQNAHADKKIEDSKILDTNKLFEGNVINFGLPSNILNKNYLMPIQKHKIRNNFVNKESKINRYRVEHPSDYEIFYQNEVIGPRTCGKNKVRIYLDTQNSKIRDPNNDYTLNKYCD